MLVKFDKLSWEPGNQPTTSSLGNVCALLPEL